MRTRVRYLVKKPGGKGGSPLFYWRPSQELAAAGWKHRRLSDDEAEATGQAEAINANVDAWRKGEPVAGGPKSAAKQGPRAAPGTIEALIYDYKRSRWWDKLARATQKSYEIFFKRIIAWAGDQLARSITPRAVQAFYELQFRRTEGKGKNRRVIETPARAAAAVRVLRLLLQVGIRMGYLTKNPALKPGMSLKRQREPQLWSPDQVLHLVAVADRLGWHSVGTVVLLNEWLGQRQEDLLKAPPWKGGPMKLRQSKTGRTVMLPIHLVPHLVQRLQAEAKRPGALTSLTHLLVHETTGKAWHPYTFRAVFSVVREAAVAGVPADKVLGLPEIPAMPSCEGLLFRELRHTAVTRLHEAEVDELGIASVTGHTAGSVKMILDRHYLVRTQKGAEQAFKKRLAAQVKGEAEDG